MSLLPSSRPGPDVAGQPTVLTTLSPAQLRASNFGLGLHHTINAAFFAAPNPRPGNKPRLASADSFLEHLREAPSTFTVILHRPHSHSSGSVSLRTATAHDDPQEDTDNAPAVLATASARRYAGPGPVDPSAISVFERQDAVRADVQEWELKLLAVAPGLQRQGLAGLLMEAVEAEIRRRFVEERKEDGGGGGGGAGGGSGSRQSVKMLLSTLKEEQASFYARKGYALDYELPRGEGTSWHVAFMSKELVSKE